MFLSIAEKCVELQFYLLFLLVSNLLSVVEEHNLRVVKGEHWGEYIDRERRNNRETKKMVHWRASYFILLTTYYNNEIKKNEGSGTHNTLLVNDKLIPLG